MNRFTFASAVLLAAGLAKASVGQTPFTSVLEKVHTAPHHELGSGQASLTLSPDQTTLFYSIQLGDLDLEPVAANRTDVNDVTGIHLHFFVGEGVTGPHVLNIFGDFGEEDDDLMVDFANESLTGAYDLSDATLDPATGLPQFQFFPTTTKIIGDWIDELLAGQLYLAIHTKGQNGGPLLHGDVVQVPEPNGVVIACVAITIGHSRRRATRGGRVKVLDLSFFA